MNRRASMQKHRSRERVLTHTLAALGVVVAFGCSGEISPPPDVPACGFAPRALISACVTAEDGLDIDQPGEGGVRSVAFAGTVERTESLLFGEACPGGGGASTQWIGHVPFNGVLFDVVTISTPQRRWRVALNPAAGHIAIAAGAVAALQFRAAPSFDGQVAELEMRSDGEVVAYLAEGIALDARVYAPELELRSAGHHCWRGQFHADELIAYAYVDRLLATYGNASVAVEPTSVASVGNLTVINEELREQGSSDMTCGECAPSSFLVGAVRVLPEL